MKDILLSLWKLASRADRCRFYILLLMMFIAGNLELLGIGLILPVVALLTNPELIHQNYFLKLIRQIINPSSDCSFILILCGIITGIFLLKNVFLAFLTWYQAEMIRLETKKLTTQLFSRYIHAPYSLFLARNSAEILSHLTLMDGAGRGIILSFLMQVIELINILMILTMLFFFVPMATLLLIVIAIVTSVIIYIPIRKADNDLGRNYSRVLGSMNRNRLQAFGGIKEIRIHNAENFFADRDENDVDRSGRIMCKINFLAQLPRFLMEFSMVTGGMLLLAIYILSGTANTSIILKLSLLGAAVVRLVPSLSRIQYHITNLRSYCGSIASALRDLQELTEEQVQDEDKCSASLEQGIIIEDLSFCYQGAVQPVFSHLSFEIPSKTSVAFIGHTGCGKTTLVDLIAGLLTPSEGRILADGTDIQKHLQSWRSMIGYVSQSIYILDDSILANVTLGIPDGAIDISRAEECLKMAQILDFVKTLPQGIHTKVGEGGCRLSGGQRQRLGIARALYSQPKLLILDEATSALDNETEQAFMDAINTLYGKMTIIVIAHRLSTTKGCSQIIDIGKLSHDAKTTA